MVPDGPTALRAVTQTIFRPAGPVVLQATPGVAPRPGVLRGLSWSEPSPEHLRVDVTTTAPAIVLIRNSFDHDWMSSVDGRPSKHVLAADYLLKGVAVPAGRHVVDIRYEDSTIGEGLMASGLAWALFAGVLGVAVVQRRRPRSARERHPAD